MLGFYLTAEKQIPGVKIIRHVLIYEVPLHVITDICHTTPWLVHPSVQKFPYRELSLCRSQNIPMGQEIQRKRKEPTERRTTQRFPMLVPKTDPGELSVNSWKCHYYTLIKPRNQRAARNIDCAMLNETQKSCNNSAKNFSTHESTTKKAKEGPKTRKY